MESPPCQSSFQEVRKFIAGRRAFGCRHRRPRDHHRDAETQRGRREVFKKISVLLRPPLCLCGEVLTLVPSTSATHSKTLLLPCASCANCWFCLLSLRSHSRT